MAEVKRLRLLGAGGHAKVAGEAWLSSGGEIVGWHDDAAERRAAPAGAWPMLGTLDAAFGSGDALHIAIGDNVARQRAADEADDARFPPVVHAAAILSPTVRIGPGSLVCAGALLQADAAIGRHAIVNSGALIEHDCRIGDFVHIGPGVRLGGNVTVGAGALIGIGAIVIPGVAIGADALVGAGAVVLRDVPAGATMAGNPARALRQG